MRRYGRKKMRGTAFWHPAGDAEARGDMKSKARQRARRHIREELEELEGRCHRAEPQAWTSSQS
tara:strand:- start:687 stop:878 length:192 start_codon:yes stop_codon:yes gene_type:complete